MFAITAGAQQKGIDLKEVKDFKSITGKGVSGIVDGQNIQIGSKGWLEECGITQWDKLASAATHYEQDGSSIAWAAIDGVPAGLLVIADQLKPNTCSVVSALKSRGLDIIMLTGDSEQSAQFMAQQAGIEQFYSKILPHKKAEKIAALTSSGKTTLMVGDGINDAPALATADIGIAIGTGTETARASGHIILTSGNLSGLVQVIDLSRAVMRNIRQNLFFAFAYNVIMIPVAAGALFPSTGLVLTPVLASIAMSASCITVISNALRLRKLNLTTIQ